MTGIVIMMNPRRIVLACAFALAAPSARAVIAGCAAYPTQGPAQTVSFGVVRVPAGATPGTVLARAASQPPWTIPRTKCEKALRFARLGIFNRPSAAGPYVYDTNVAGIGIRIRHLGFQSDFNDVPVPSQSAMVSWALFPVSNGHFQVELVVTGPVAGGGALTSGTIAEAGFDGHSQWSATIVNTRIEAERPTCGFVSKQVVFDIGAIDGGELAAQGHSRWASQSLVTTGCPNVTEMALAFAGPADPNDATLFRLDDAEGTARGVAVELRSDLDNQQALPQGAVPVVLPAGPEGRLYGFRARYRMNGARLAAGSADVSITVDVTYR